jgi:hypothetical protein
MRIALEELTAIQMLNAHFPTIDGRTIAMLSISDDAACA